MPCTQQGLGGYESRRAISLRSEELKTLLVQSHYQEKLRIQITNVTTATLHMDSKLQHVIVTVFKTQPSKKKKSRYLHAELSIFE